jgi:hypothetical protein
VPSENLKALDYDIRTYVGQRISKKSTDLKCYRFYYMKKVSRDHISITGKGGDFLAKYFRFIKVQ